MNMFALGNGLIKFNGLNYAEWSEQVQFQLGVMSLDMAIVSDRLEALTEDSTDAQKTHFEA